MLLKQDELGKDYSSIQLDFLALLAESEALVKWLLEHKNQAEFNQLLQVCRPNTDETAPPLLHRQSGANPNAAAPATVPQTAFRRVGTLPALFPRAGC